MWEPESMRFLKRNTGSPKIMEPFSPHAEGKLSSRPEDLFPDKLSSSIKTEQGTFRHKSQKIYFHCIHEKLLEMCSTKKCIKQRHRKLWNPENRLWHGVEGGGFLGDGETPGGRVTQLSPTSPDGEGRQGSQRTFQVGKN